MTKFRLLSDLHLGFAKFKLPELPDDHETVLLLAGDIDEGKGARKWIERHGHRFKFVVYCAGNHEYYNREYHALNADWQAAAATIPNFHFLHDDICVVDDVRIMGGCLWTNLNSRDWFAVERAKRAMNDYRAIRVNKHVDSRNIYKSFRHKGNLLSPLDTVDFYESTVSFLEGELQNQWDGKTLIMTHHLPSSIGLHPFYREGKDNYAYYSNLEWMMHDYKIDAWVHGHSHYSHDTMVFDTRVMSNARGYHPHESVLKTGFNPNFTFTL